MSPTPELLLPRELLAAACCSDNEWGWPPELIPQVIAEGKRLDLLSLGGQLQFILPTGTCECYWVSVDPLRTEPSGLSWQERVALAAERSLEQFSALRLEFDFLAEGQRAFGQYFDDLRACRGDPAEYMCFFWYLESASSI